MLEHPSWPALDESKAEGGMHHHFGKFVGEWKGGAKTWFEPGKLADESPMRASFSLGVDGQHLFFNYEGALSKHLMIGQMIIACNVDLQMMQVAWVDSNHTRAQILHFTGPIPDTRNPFTVQGTYKCSPDMPEWGWSICFDLKSEHRLEILHRNIMPAGAASDAVLMELVRG